MGDFLKTCTLNTCHLKRLIALEASSASALPSLDPRIFVVETDSHKGDFGEAEEAIMRLLAEDDKQQQQPVAIVFGAVQHWLTLVLARTSSGLLALVGDSHNKPLLSGRPVAEVAGEATEAVYARFAGPIALSSLCTQKPQMTFCVRSGKTVSQNGGRAHRRTSYSGAIGR